jgi:hypothetical protein
MVPRSDLGAVNKEIFLVGVISRPQFHCPLSHRLVNAYWALRAQFCMSSRNKSCYHLSHNLLLSQVGMCSFKSRVHVCRRLLISDNQGHNPISPRWVCSGVSDTETCPHSLIPSPHSVSFHNWCLFTFNPPTTKSVQFHGYSMSFPFFACVSCHQFLWRHKTPDWCRSQLRCLEFRGLDKILSDIAVSKDAHAVALLFAALPYMSEGRGFDSH